MGLIFFDIDGTLAMGTDVPASAAAAVAATRAKGNLVWICTGRPLSYAQTHFGGYADGFVCSNGRYAVLDGRPVYDHPLTPDQVREIARRLEPVGVGWLFDGVDAGWYGGNPDGFETMSHVQKPGYARRGVDPDAIRAYTLDVWVPDVSELPRVAEALDGIALVNPHTPHPSADITVLGVDKGTALAHIAETLGVAREDTYAFGDGVNDLCMLEAAGHGIAMGNAVPALKRAADFVTTDIDRDGVCNGLAHFGLL